jgi:hypothetical protein
VVLSVVLLWGPPWVGRSASSRVPFSAVSVAGCSVTTRSRPAAPKVTPKSDAVADELNQHVTTILTAIVGVAWVANFAMRVIDPGWPVFSAALDPALLVVIGYWFTGQGVVIKKARDRIINGGGS